MRDHRGLHPVSCMRHWRSRSHPPSVLSAIVVVLRWIAPAVLALALLLLFEKRRWSLARPEGFCQACGYLLCGLPVDTYRCPECGTVFRGAGRTPNTPANSPGTNAY
jgi:hypothetical protein